GSFANAALVGANTVNGPGLDSVSTRPAAFTAATSVVWSLEFTAFWMMFFEGYMGAPPTVTVCSFICASDGVAASAARPTAAAATDVNKLVRNTRMSFSICCGRAASAAGTCRYGAHARWMQAEEFLNATLMACSPGSPSCAPAGS